MFVRALMPLFLGAWVWVAAGSAVFADEGENSLHFGVYTSDKPTAMVKKLRPILDILEKRISEELGRQIEIHMQVAPSYEAGINALVEGKVDFARFGPASYVLAREKDPDISLLAVESNRGGMMFDGIICVREDSPIKDIRELEGKLFAFGDPNSTIGRYLSQLYLMRHGITADNLGYYEYLGRHDIVGEAVSKGRFDAGALKVGTFNKLQKKGAALRVLASFPNITKPWIARSGLPEANLRAIRAAMLNLEPGVINKDKENRPFLPADEGDFAFIADAIRVNPEFFVKGGGGE